MVSAAPFRKRGSETGARRCATRAEKTMAIDIALLAFLILLNAVFAMCEIAVVSSRKARLQRLADSGRPGAPAALALHEEPSRFLSTIQVGITSIGILSGAVGEAALADPLRDWLRTVPAIEPWASSVALTVVVVALTYVSVVVGELVPKRLGLLAPEAIASLVARPMNALSCVARPLVWLLSASSDLILRITGARRREEHPVTDEEIKVLMLHGAESGVFHESEREIVANVLRLDEQRVGSIMTPRLEVYRVDLNAAEAVVRQRLLECPHEHIVVCRGSAEQVAGILRRADLLVPALQGLPLDLTSRLHTPLYVTESLTLFQLLDNFRRARAHIALVVDEYGALQGLVTLGDMLRAIVGERLLPEEPEDAGFARREDGALLIEGTASMDRVKQVLEREEDPPGRDVYGFNTIAGFVMHSLERIPVAGDHVDWDGLRFEVAAMEGNRIAQVLVTPAARRPPPISDRSRPQ